MVIGGQGKKIKSNAWKESKTLKLSNKKVNFDDR